MAKYKVLIEEIERPEKSLLDLLGLFNKYSYPFLLDSACDHKGLGKFSFFGCDPFLVFRSKGSSIKLKWPDGRTEVFESNPFTALRNIFNRYGNIEGPEEIPFIGGGVGYFAYDLKDFIEDLPNTAIDDLGAHDCIMGFYDVIIILDNLKSKLYIMSSGMPESNPARNRARAKERLKEFKDRISSPVKTPLRIKPKMPRIESNFSKRSYIEAIEKAKEYIKKGDIYQVNLSQRFQSNLTMEPIDLYSRLRSFSPAPFSSFLDFQDVAVVSSSPERFLAKRGSYIETRPIKGTRPRGKDPLSDTALEQELLQSLKDRAEHIMIVDLQRNDLGMVCDYGTVKLVESMALEKYANVFHLVSTVSGTLKEGIGPIDCLSATFPGGSITGAPKIRSMEIIEELERIKRSVYTGAIGYISFNGNMDTSIAIRMFIVKDDKAFFSVGGGIVADSDPEKEYDETLHKAKGMLQALGAGDYVS